MRATAHSILHHDQRTAAKYERLDRLAARDADTLVMVGAAKEGADKIGGTALDEWCDAYMVRLAATTVRTSTKPGKPPSARTAGTDAAVLGALCSLMREAGCGCFPASEVAVARRAHVAEMTAAAALKRLEEAAYIARVPARSPRPCGGDATGDATEDDLSIGDAAQKYKSSHGSATHYALVVERLEQVDPRTAPRSLAEVTGLESLATGDLSHEAYAAKILGKAAGVYLALLRLPDSTKADLHRATGRSKPTVREALEKARMLGMADEEGGRWRATRRVQTDDDLDEVNDTGRRINAARARARREEREREAAADAALCAAVTAAHYHGVAAEANARLSEAGEDGRGE